MNAIDGSSQPHSAGLPVDLELHVTTVSAEGDLRLSYRLHSPSGVVPNCYNRPAGEQQFGLETNFNYALRLIYSQLEALCQGKDIDGQAIPRKQVENELADIGHDLYERFFPESLRSAYRDFRSLIRSMAIVSDDRWSIPWELIRPFADDFEDDFLCIQFQLCRWLADSVHPASEIHSNHITAIGTGSQSETTALPGAADEIRMLASLRAGSGTVHVEKLPDATTQDLKDVLIRGGFGVLHFAGHGGHVPDQPGESSIMLSDRRFRARSLTGKIQITLQAERPLVFLNACSVAQQGWWLSGLAGWAERWVRGCGCGAFIGPLWKVDDDAALRFASVFYERLLSGKTLGEAIQEARKVVRDEFAETLCWAAYSVYANPNASSLVSGESYKDAESRPGRIPPGIRESILDFGRFITEKTDGFVGRKWVFDRFAAFQDQHSRGYFVLRGDPGIGKSALAAEVVRRDGCPHHFNIRAEGITGAEDFFRNICAQLIAAFNLQGTILPAGTEQGRRLFKELLEVIVKKRPEDKVTIVIDALDEAVALDAGVNPLYLPLTVPPGVYILATSRRNTSLRIDCEVETLDIEQDDAGNLADVQAFVESYSGKPGVSRYRKEFNLSEDEFVKELVERSQGNFMYLRFVLPEIESGAYQDREPDTLPEGLNGYYQDHWQRMRARDETLWFNYQLPVLMALSSVTEPVPIDLVSYFSGVSELARVNSVLVEWDAFIYKRDLRVGGEGNLRKHYRLYHDSFRDFIAAKEEIASERVNLKAAHKKIGALLKEEFRRSKEDRS